MIAGMPLSALSNLLPIDDSLALIADRSRGATADSPVGGSFHWRGPMFRGILIAVLVVLGASQLDQYFCHGKYTDGAMSMLRQIRHSVRV